MFIFKRPVALIFYALVMFFSGIIMMVYSGWALLDTAQTNSLIKDIPFHDALFFYYHFPLWVLSLVLPVRMGLAIIQIVAGISLLRLQLWALQVTRFFLIVFLTTTFLNPYYPDFLSNALIFFYACFLLYFFHPRLEGFCHHFSSKDTSTRTKPPLEKSRLAVLLGCLEILFGLGLLRFLLWEFSSSELAIEFTTSLNLAFNLVIPKSVLLLVTLIVFMTGILTLYFRPIGRMLNILLCIFAFILACAGVFFVSQPNSKSANLLLQGEIVIALFLSVIVFFLLTNPKVKIQFRGYQRSRFGRLGGMIGFGIFCALVFQSIQISMQRYPQLFNSSAINKIASRSEQWDGSMYQKKWISVQKEGFNLYKSFQKENKPTE
jgi:hypothetical protein